MLDYTATHRTTRPTRPQRIMIVEDEGMVAMDLEDRLREMGFEVVATVDNAADAVALANTLPIDLALMDINLRGPQDGIDAAKQIRQMGRVTVIFITAHADDETLARAGQAEPFGYVLKPFDERDLRAAIEIALARSGAEQRLRKIQRWFSTTLQSIGDGVISISDSSAVTFLNPVAERLTGWSSKDAVGRPISDVFPVFDPGGEPETQELVRTAMERNSIIYLGEGKSLRTRSGKLLPVDDSIAPLRDEEGKVSGCVIVFRDNSERLARDHERQRLETKMQDAQRLESLGVLAGGIAHDFNNLLTVVTCNANLVEGRLTENHPAGPCLQNILKASDRAAQLCSQMLAYAGKGRLSARLMDLNALTQDSAELLRVAMGDNATLVFELTNGLPPIFGDASQLMQVIMNLVINGSEALDGSVGTVTVRTRVVEVDRLMLSTCRVGEDLPIGSYLMLEVEDTGHGMIPETLAKVFDPFYTTKFTGRGLGLAAVLGIVRSHKGALAVSSTPCVGTTFQVLLPPVEVAAEMPVNSAPPRCWRGSGKVLLVEDDDAVRSAAKALLETVGFTVETAENGLQAVEQIIEAEGQFRVIVMDLTMPVMDGHTAFGKIRTEFPDLKILIMSGYSDEEATKLLKPSGPTAFMQKPFTYSGLIAKLSALLD